MPLPDETSFQAVYDHYKETFGYLREYIKTRDRYFFYAILALSFQIFTLSSPEDSLKTASSFAKKTLGFELFVGQQFLAGILWFVLLVVVLKYFQITISIERQYQYLHRVEKELRQMMGNDLIGREGESYLTKYPLFSNWAHVLYRWVFPLLLIGIAVSKIVHEWLNGVGWLLILDSMCIFGSVRDDWTVSVLKKTIGSRRVSALWKLSSINPHQIPQN